MAKRKQNQQPEPKADEATYIVKRRFQDAPEYRLGGVAEVYEPGDDVSHFDENRLKGLVERGNVMVIEPEVPAATPPALDPTPAPPAPPQQDPPAPPAQDPE